MTMNAASAGFCRPSDPYAMALAPSSICNSGKAPKLCPCMVGRSFPQAPTLHHPACKGGQVPGTRIEGNFLYLVGQRPRWSACCPRGARQGRGGVGNHRTRKGRPRPCGVVGMVIHAGRFNRLLARPLHSWWGSGGGGDLGRGAASHGVGALGLSHLKQVGKRVA
jgi:hypothetical protein